MRALTLTAALTLSLGAAAPLAAAATCDQIWTAFNGAPLGKKIARDAAWSEAEYRYRAAQVVFAKAADVTEGKTPADLKAEGKTPMDYSMRLMLSDKVLTCYAAEAGTFAADQEVAMPPDRRADIIAPFRPKG